MSKIDSKQLIATNLKYSKHAKPLKTLAFAQILLKAMYKAKKPLSLEGHGNNIARLMNIPKVSNILVENAMKDLEKEKNVVLENNKWSLTKKGQQFTKGNYKQFQKQLLKTLSNHFPSTINVDSLANWFTDAISIFFGYFGDEWVKSICKNIPAGFSKHQTIEDLLSSPIDTHHLKQYKQELLDGFFNFIKSQNTHDQSFLMNLVHSFFTAKLVAADIGADFITINEISNSKFVLDTNVLFAISLKKHFLSQSMKSLGSALKSINSKLVYLNETKEEYKRVCDGNKGGIINLLDLKYSIEILYDKDMNNDFLTAAKKLRCREKKDFISFFSTIRKIPKKMWGGPNINIEDDDEIEKIVNRAKNDTELKMKIKKFSDDMKPYWKKSKSNLALEHDSSLLHASEFIRKDEGKCWILSVDRTLQACDAERTGPYSMPIIISLDALIQILALDNAGPNLKSTDFAPLLSALLINKCTPPPDTFTTTDLHWLHGLNERALDFSPEKIKQFVKFVAKNRLEGKMPSDNRFQLEFQRMFQKAELELNQEIEKYKDQTKSAEALSKKLKINESKTKKALINKLEKEIIKSAKDKLVKTLISRFLLVSVGALILRNLFILFLSKLSFDTLFGDILTLILTIFSLAKWTFYIPRKEYEKLVKESNREAKKEVEKTLQ